MASSGDPMPDFRCCSAVGTIHYERRYRGSTSSVQSRDYILPPRGARTIDAKRLTQTRLLTTDFILE